MSTDKPPKGKGGRPAGEGSADLQVKIVATATRLFMQHGYGATSIEAIAKAAGVSKRTIYHRYDDKGALFRDVVHSLIIKLSPPSGIDSLFTGDDLEAVLKHLTTVILKAALQPEALALHRMMIAEGGRFPALANAMVEEGTRRKAVDGIAAILVGGIAKSKISVNDPAFAAEQFLLMVVTSPRNRALGMGTAMSEAEVEKWANDTVEFFLRALKPSLQA